jgi:hypothetical protein
MKKHTFQELFYATVEVTDSFLLERDASVTDNSDVFLERFYENAPSICAESGKVPEFARGCDLLRGRKAWRGPLKSAPKTALVGIPEPRSRCAW